MRAIILAADFGTRLYPLTQGIPKAFLELGGKTLIDHLMGKLEPFPMIEEVTVITNGRFWLDVAKWRKDSHYKKPIHVIDNHVFHPEKRLGAVMDLELAIRARRNERPQDDFLVLCGDNYFDFPLSHFLLRCLAHPRSGFAGLYDVKDPQDATKFGVAALDSHERIIDFEEKPSQPKSTLVSIGVYYFPSATQLRLYEYLELERRNPDKIGDFLAWLVHKEPLYGVEFDGTWFDIGDVHSYEEARRQLDVTRV